jgi:chromosomal replication initiation ATPase DnaA
MNDKHEDLMAVFYHAWESSGHSLDAAVDAVARAAVLQLDNRNRPIRRTREELQAPLLEVAGLLGVNVDILTGPSRTDHDSEVRALAMWLLRRKDMPWRKLSYPEIGAVLLRDHSTAMTAIRKVNGTERLLMTGYAIVERVHARKEKAA